MATKNCAACADLQDYAPEFVLNGVTDNVCASLANDTGFNPSNDRDDCTDLSDASDCLVGNMDDEIEAYDVCDWKTYMHNLVPNVYNLFKAFSCAVCGLWTNIHSLWSKTNALDCAVNYLYNGARFDIGEDTTAGSYVVAGKGVSFLEVGEGELQSDIHMNYIAGGLIIGSGSLHLYSGETFNDDGYCYNFDNNGVSPERTKNGRSGNSLFAGTGRYASGGELLYEIRIKKSQYPQLSRIFAGIGHETNGGAYRITVNVFDGDRTSNSVPTVYAYGNHGECLSNGTRPDSHQDYDLGHPVPTGWIYVQTRLSYVDIAFSNGGQYTPRYLCGVRMNIDEAPC